MNHNENFTTVLILFTSLFYSAGIDRILQGVGSDLLRHHYCKSPGMLVNTESHIINAIPPGYLRCEMGGVDLRYPKSGAPI